MFSSTADPNPTLKDEENFNGLLQSGKGSEIEFYAAWVQIEPDDLFAEIRANKDYSLPTNNCISVISAFEKETGIKIEWQQKSLLTIYKDVYDMAIKGKDWAENTKNSFKNLLHSLQTELIKTGIEDNSLNENISEVDNEEKIYIKDLLQLEEEIKISGDTTE